MNSKCARNDCFPSLNRRIVAEYEKTIAQMIGEFHSEYWMDPKLSWQAQSSVCSFLSLISFTLHNSCPQLFSSAPLCIAKNFIFMLAMKWLALINALITKKRTSVSANTGLSHILPSQLDLTQSLFCSAPIFAPHYLIFLTGMPGE